MTLSFSSEDISKLKNVIDSGVVTNGEIKALRESLRDVVDETAKDLDIPKKLLNDAIRVAFKAAEKGSVREVLDETQDGLDEVEELLQALGRK